LAAKSFRTRAKIAYNGCLHAGQIPPFLTIGFDSLDDKKKLAAYGAEARQ
jgi:hypothetical protein